MTPPWKLSQISKRLGMPPRRLLNAMKRDGLVTSTAKGPEPNPRNISAELFQPMATFTPIETSAGIINKHGVTVGVLPKGIDYLVEHYSHLIEERPE
jgi:hypothetical protein